MTEQLDECQYDDGDEAYAGEEYDDEDHEDKDEEVAETYAGQCPLLDPSSIVVSNAVRGVVVIIVMLPPLPLMLLLVAILSW